MKRAALIALCLLAASVAPARWTIARMYQPQTDSTTDVTSGLVAWWTCDSTNGNVCTDSIGNNHMTLTGSPPLVAGHKGNAIQTALGKYGAFAPMTNTVYTLSFWGFALGNGDMTPISSSSTVNNYLEHSSSTKWEYNVAGSVADWNSTSTSTGVWYHVALVATTSNVTLYVNGLTQGSRTLSNPNSSVHNQFGHYYTSGSYFWNGYLDDFRIYNRSLTSNEVLQVSQQ